MSRSRVLFALIAMATVGTTLASASDTVYVSERNGAAYHSADCQRLRFPKPMPLIEAALQYRPCPVCQGKAGNHDQDRAFAPSIEVSTPVAESVPQPPAISLPESAPTPPVQERPVAIRRAPSPRNDAKARWILGVIGGVVGFATGATINLRDCVEECEHDAFTGTTVLVALTIGGAVGGSALGYALTDHSASVDRALDRDRAAIRAAHAEQRLTEAAGDDLSSAARSVLSSSGRPVTN